MKLSHNLINGSTPLTLYILFSTIFCFHSNFFTTAIEPDPNTIFPLVTTPLGQLRGLAEKSFSGRWYYGFQGIPYAQPSGRFQAAEVAQPWTGLRDARLARNACPHINGSMGFIGDEDCLTLSVYFPHYDRCQEDPLLPVLIFIHGGSYTNGAGSIFSMNHLADECLVVVFPNYRQGALGFLTTNDGLIPGNLGLKDQNLAFKWVQNYISHFRGDPNLVTIMGVSSGASAVSHHVASPASKNLFHRAISQSGSILSPWSVIEDPELESRILAAKLNCSFESTAAIKSCLEAVDVKDIVSNQISSPFNPTPFAPVIELETAENPFQTQHPAQRLLTGDFNKVPLIAGFVENEYLLEDPVAIELLNKFWFESLPTLFMFDQLGLSQEEMDRISGEIRQFYFGNEVIGPKNRQNLTNMLSDRFFVQGVFETVDLHSKFVPVYPYILTFKGDSRAWKNHGYEIPIVSHGDDEQYFFNRDPFDFGTDQYTFSKLLIKYWTNFVKFGQPDVSGESGEDSWGPVIGQANDIWHKLDMPEKNLINFMEERRSFWQNLGLFEIEWNFQKKI